MITPEHKARDRRRARLAARRAAMEKSGPDEKKTSFLDTKVGQWLNGLVEGLVGFLGKVAIVAGIAIAALQLRPAHEMTALYELCQRPMALGQSVGDCLMDLLPAQAQLADAVALIEPLGFSEEVETIYGKTTTYTRFKAPGWPLEFRYSSVVIKQDPGTGLVKDIDAYHARVRKNLKGW